MDFVESVRAQWAVRRPDLDTAPADVAARLTRIASLLAEENDVALARHGLTRPELDVLAALRRAGRPLRAREITTMTRAPGASVTKRLDRLEGEGLVARHTLERDRRGVLVELTPAGTALVDRVFPEQVERERALVDVLGPEDQAELARLLRALLRRLDPADYPAPEEGTPA